MRKCVKSVSARDRGAQARWRLQRVVSSSSRHFTPELYSNHHEGVPRGALDLLRRSSPRDGRRLRAFLSSSFRRPAPLASVISFRLLGGAHHPRRCSGSARFRLGVLCRRTRHAGAHRSAAATGREWALPFHEKSDVQWSRRRSPRAGLVLSSVRLLEYAATVLVCFHLFVVLYEEPSLESRFGESYLSYRKAVPRWGFTVQPFSTRLIARIADSSSTNAVGFSSARTMNSRQTGTRAICYIAVAISAQLRLFVVFLVR
jgi:hypothetical protein